ncbi:putative RNA helicase [Helianthus annuus]|uniref:RNA helicase n=1 Tax=Helianthus annuus TaxID=4232 RepID=A0A9K3DSC3_HELAN|nr:putative RNA helicase [Helianthus annuus]KAJ0438759.1 putative RNA helicase [Helianthus annuus]KAJ0443645.1 putative RNA helicase [Helianthus annuus]KAJ0461111.1 putative RNA helicase [Helianthus annuus]KAJ0641534.1 putative RNA helicase [Helianthus annuus]
MNLKTSFSSASYLWGYTKRVLTGHLQFKRKASPLLLQEAIFLQELKMAQGRQLLSAFLLYKKSINIKILCGLLHFAFVILAPTRELALQTSQVCKELGKHLNIQVMVTTTGGTSLKDDIMRLYQPVHLLAGTPGRILDLAKQGICALKDCAMLVMDEVQLNYIDYFRLEST